MNVRFGVFADLHTDFMHDAKERLAHFLTECEKKNVDFCVQLGDFCAPNGINQKDKNKIVKKLEEYPIPFYHLLGNHDMDANSKEEVIAYLGSEKRHGSFDYGGIHFVMLDTNFFQLGNEYFPYDHGNYRTLPGEAKVPILPPSELEWLDKDLAKAKYPSVIFTHHSLIESRSGIRNAFAFREVIKKAPKGVILAVCGHEHLDRLRQKAGTWYLCVNSMSYYWAGSKYRHDTYDKQIVKRYPKLDCVFPYRNPLFCIIEIRSGRISVHGRSSEFVGATPKEMNFKKWGLKDPITASIKNKRFGVKKHENLRKSTGNK